MTILSIETSTDVCSAALSVGGVCIAHRIQREGSNHAAILPVFVDELLSEAKSRGLALEAIALSEGPGSYTGLRIGTSLAKGLCYGLDIPLIPIATTKVLCAAFAVSSAMTELPSDALLCPMIDARRMEVYTALYDTQLAVVSDVQAKVVDADSYDSFLSQSNVYFFGNGAMKCQPVIESKNAHFIDYILPDAQYMGILAEQLDCRRYHDTELAYYDPLYVKEFVAAPSHVKGLS